MLFFAAVMTWYFFFFFLSLPAQTEMNQISLFIVTLLCDTVIVRQHLSLKTLLSWPILVFKVCSDEQALLACRTSSPSWETNIIRLFHVAQGNFYFTSLDERQSAVLDSKLYKLGSQRVVSAIMCFVFSRMSVTLCGFMCPWCCGCTTYSRCPCGLSALFRQPRQV